MHGWQVWQVEFESMHQDKSHAMLRHNFGGSFKQEVGPHLEGCLFSWCLPIVTTWTFRWKILYRKKTIQKKQRKKIYYVNALGKQWLFLYKYHDCKSLSASLIPMFNASQRYWMSPHLVVASECLPPLCCSRPCFLILSCSAYLACAQRVEAVMSIASTPLPMWTDRAPSHTSACTFVKRSF